MTPIKKRSEGHTKKFRQQKRCVLFIVEKIKFETKSSWSKYSFKWGYP